MRRFFQIAALSALLAACAPQEGAQEGEESTEAAAETPVRILTQAIEAEAGVVDLIEIFTSELTPYKENDITPAASGVRVDKIYFDIGDSVTKGDIVARLDPTLYNQQIISVGNLKADYERLLPVYEAGGISRQTLDQAKVNYDIQQEVADNIKKNIELRSPLTGVVTERSGEDGDLYVGNPILHIAQIDKLKVEVAISEQYFSAVKVGMPVQILVDIYPQEIFEGEVSLIYPSLNAMTRTFTAQVTIPNRGMKLRPGMFARSRFNMGRKEAILVEDISVQKQYGSAENYIYVANEDGTAERRTVVRGRQVGSKVDILSGVEPGEHILTTAFSRLSDGAAIELK